ncbi:hypothetical protein Tco_0034029 [Tanacetum coccineum]
MGAPQVPLLELDRFGILLGEQEEGEITSSGWPFVFAVLGQMAHLVTSITLNSTRSCVMQSAFLTQGTVSNIPLLSIIGVTPKNEGWAKEFHQDRASSVKVPVANFTLQSLVQLLWENTDSVRSN